jgi:hypothetical protein
MTTLIPVKAGGDIRPARFVSAGAANNTVLESEAGDVKILGVSQEATKNAPQEGGSTLAAAANDQFEMFPWGSDPLLELGAGGCAAFDWLKPDADGKGVVAAGAAVAGAIAFEAGSAGEKVKVLVMPPRLI